MNEEKILTIAAARYAQLVLAQYVRPSARNPEMTIDALLSILDRSDVVEAVDRLEDSLYC